MGNRVSIQFTDGKSKSAVLFSHWDGQTLVDGARIYIEKLNDEMQNKHGYPLGRCEPDTVMVDFLREMLAGHERITSNYYMPDSIDGGDNSDNGHYLVNTKTGNAEHYA